MPSVNVGTASVTIMPTMNGFAAKMDKALGSAGTSGAAAFSKSFGSKAAGATGGIASRFRSAGSSAGSQMGASIGSALSAKGAAIAGVAGGIASAAAQKVVAAISSLSGEIADASDSAQKFASTLSFGGVDSSTIEALTASTQKYADETVYDLSDIRNTTAQLAANGVDDYAQLAEAAGNLNAVAGGNADTFKSVAMVMTQTAGAGKLTTENWNQLSDAIPGASGKLQEALKANGAYTGNFREAMEKGQISAEEFNQAIIQLGMTDIAKEAATSTATIEGAMGNLEASAVTAGSKILDAFKPMITGAMASAGGVIDGIGDAVADFLSKCQDNGAIQVLSDDLSLLGGAIADVFGAIGNLAGALLGVEPGASDAAGAADAFKSALDKVHPIIQGVSDAAKWLRDNAAKAAPAVRALAIGFVLMKAASAVAGAVKSLSGTLGAISSLSTVAAGGLSAMAGGETAAGTAAGASATNMLKFGAAVLLVGAGVALAAAGILLLATAAIQVASAGPAAALAMLGMVAAVAALALGAAALGPALAAGAVGMVAFGAAVLMVGAGIALATSGVAALAPMLPMVAAYGASAAVGIAALGAGMVVLGAGSIVAAAGLVALAAGVAILGAGLLVAAAAVAVLAVGVAALAAGMSLIAASVTVSASGFMAMGAALPAVASSAPGAAAGLAALAAAAAAAVPGLLAGSPAMQAFAGACSSASSAVGSMGAAVTSAASAAVGGMERAKASALSMAAAGKSAFSAFASSAKSASASAAAAISAACASMAATVASMRLTIPRMEIAALPHFRLDGRFDPESGSVPSVAVDWYAKGGVFSSASVIGVGEAGPEAVVPLRPSVLRGIGEGIEIEGGGSREVISWLASNLPAIIAECTPTVGERDFARMARKAVANG